MSNRETGNYRYGTSRKEYLKTEYPMQYQILLMTGELPVHLKKIEKEAQALKRQLTQVRLRGSLSSDFLTNLQNIRQTEQAIEEEILTTVVYRPLETID